MLKALLVAVIFLTFGVQELQAEPFEEGVHYEVISDSRESERGIAEFFSFYCIHCYRFEVIADLLEEEYGEEFTKIHISSAGPNAEVAKEMTKAYILAEKLNLSKEIGSSIFSYNFDKKMMLRSREDIKNVFALYDISGEQYENDIDSFSVKATMNHWQRLHQKYGVRATPTFIVNGKYKLNPISLKDSKNFSRSFLELTDYLINK